MKNISKSDLKTILEGFDISVTIDEKDSSAELSSYTRRSVNVVSYLEPFSVESFKEYVKNFDIDEHIMTYRNDPTYVSYLSIKESVEDFEYYIDKLNAIVKHIEIECNQTNYKVIFEIDILASNPVDAAEIARQTILNSEDKFQWYVKNNENPEESFSVDLLESPENMVTEAKWEFKA